MADISIREQHHTSAETAVQNGESTAAKTLKNAEKNSAKKRGKKNNLLPMLAVIIGMIVFLYPVFATQWNNHQQQQVALEYKKFIQKSDPAKLEAALQKAHEYNQYRAHGPILDPWLSRITDDNEKYKEYLSLLNLSSTMARIVIPDIHVNLPIFHGTRPNALENGVGHLFGTDLPVGGTSTHSVLTAHTGLRTATLFDNLIDLKKGQSIYIEIYGQRLRYVVKDTEVVLPEETDSLHKITGKDILTLVTCTPYGVNSHRLLVHAERAPLDEENAKILDTASGFHLQWWMWLFLGGALIALLEVINILRKNRKKQKERNEPEETKPNITQQPLPGKESAGI
ncbi:class C sortase [Arcanobacterium hippocoleae]|uniref:Sortase A n=1 Tax=Arcanobacterium hippocoleae TaxID=149017 RepID=A0ABU1T2F2_9ACTO|nr:class C sortase [Arcanobacterium hippocoleae]MDR6939045.1 sortase A [Arcanobacterium hippocoleae]